MVTQIKNVGILEGRFQSRLLVTSLMVVFVHPDIGSVDKVYEPKAVGDKCQLDYKLDVSVLILYQGITYGLQEFIQCLLLHGLEDGRCIPCQRNQQRIDGHE